MLNTERMASRLPIYLQAYREDSTVRALIKSLGAEIAGIEGDLAKLMRSKWFFHADLRDLERMGALFGIPRLPGEPREPYRQRFYLTVRELLTGAGTLESISNIVEATIGSAPEMEENPPEIVTGKVRELSSDGTWEEYNKSVKEVRPTITLQALDNVRNPAVTNLTTEETVRYRGMLRKGAVLRIMPDGSASLGGIDVSSRMEYDISGEPKAEMLPPRLCKMVSEWKYTDATAFLDYGHFSRAVFASMEKEQVSIRLKWLRYRPATFDVRIPLYVKTGRSAASIGYAKHLRQEVRHLVDHVKSAGVMANINFYDHFTEKNLSKDLGPVPVVGADLSEDAGQNEDLTIETEANIRDKQRCSDEIHSCGVFDITEFDSSNAWG